MGLKGARVRLMWDLAPEASEGFTPKAGMLGTVQWGLSGWGVAFDDDPQKLIRLDATIDGGIGVERNMIDLCVDVEDESKSEPTPAPTPSPTPTKSNTDGKEPVTIKYLCDMSDMAVWRDEPDRDDLPRAWLLVGGLLCQIELVYESEEDEHLVEFQTGHAFLPADAIAWLDKREGVAYQNPYDECPKCKSNDNTWLVYERDEFASFACRCGETWAFRNGIMVK